ncbi:hypothetical protein GCM10011332_13040 [Terasakiella brassicae]|uniref:Uncharacterized protein n=1 Tax=Terasakiella brassicae TaxID=1634917 RepID=A0A917FAK3_9PROT|nr:hypothetical protein [Terasakiella brassicae]GGF60655.1 hypothetical protein GCM10011332_13040 [Terasakiella brassicae]
MTYQELGEARILKRYAKPDFLEPTHKAVVQPDRPEGAWMSLEDATVRFLQHVKSHRLNAG